MISSRVQIGPVDLIVDSQGGEFYPRIGGCQYCLAHTLKGFPDPQFARIRAVQMARQVLKKALKRLDGDLASVASSLDWKEVA